MCWEKPYGDGPAIIVSGRQPTLEDCLVAFTTTRIGDVLRSVKGADASMWPDDTDGMAFDHPPALRATSRQREDQPFNQLRNRPLG